MKNRTKVLLIVAAAILLLLLIAGGIYGGLRYRARLQHPLVRIHTPVRFEQISMGTAALLHATARSSAGIERMELWVDGELAAYRDHAAGEAASPMVLTETWVPATLGRHELIVRAVVPGGVKGQASVVVQVVEGDPPSPNYITARDLQLGAGASLGGYGESQTAGTGPASGGAPAGPPPALHDNPPGSPEEMLVLMGFFPFRGQAGEGAGPGLLHVEALQLITDADYERVFCYIGLGTMPPRWYPDLDGNPSTDEYFERLAPSEWDIAAHLAGEHAITLEWLEDSPIPLNVRCVGIMGGGTEAIELGSIDQEIARDAWDGVQRPIESRGGEGSFRIEYAVTPTGDPPGGFPTILDPSMTPPHNVRLEGAQLRWDYEPRADEEPIDGFRVYIEGTMMFELAPDVRSVFVPTQSVHPPCMESYRFHLESFRGEDWSPPSNSAVATTEPGAPGCRMVRVSFNTLTTRNLGGDDDHDPGDVGPVSGSFEVNDQIARFSGLCDGCSWDEIGLLNNYEYAINGPAGLTTDSNWLGTGPAEWVLDVPLAGEGLYLGYQIVDHDRRGEWSYLCIGSVYFEPEEVPFEEVTEGTIVSDMGPGDCEVSYSIQWMDTPREQDMTGLPPLPQLGIEEITLNAAGDKPVIHFKNTGTGDWAGHDLEIRVRSGDDSLGLFSWTGQFIPAGEGISLSHPRLSPERPLEICVEVDPYDVVVELHEAIGAFEPGAYSYCNPLPDLIITGAARQFGTGNLLISIQNIGSGQVPRGRLGFQLRTADGRTFPGVFPAYFNVDQLDPWGVTGYEWDTSNLLSPEDLNGGYTIILNPSHEISESDESNNEYEVLANGNLAFLMLGGEFRWYPLSGYDPCEPSESYDSEPQDHVITFNLRAGSIFGDRSLGSLSREYEISGPGLNWRGGSGEHRIEFELDGTEELLITVRGEIDRAIGSVDLGTAVVTPLTAEDEWGTHVRVSRLEHCGPTGSLYSRVEVFAPEPRQHQCGPWYATFMICIEE